MRVLLDTQALLWWAVDDPRLGPDAADLIATGTPVVSTVLLWEIAIKVNIGKLAADTRDIAALVADQSMERLAIADGHIFRSQDLPLHHRDPFDRLLVAQSLEEDLPILTADTKLHAYGAAILDAGA